MATKCKLTMSFVRSVESNGKNEEYPDTEQRCFRLYVSKAGVKSYAYRDNRHGGFRAICRVTEKSLPEARRICAIWVDAFRAGRDPFKEIETAKAELQAAKASKLTVQAAWEGYAAKVLPSKSTSYQSAMTRSMGTHILPSFGHRPPGEIERREWLAFREEHEEVRPSEMRQMASYITVLWKWMRDQSAYEAQIGALPDFGKIRVTAQPRSRKLTDPADVRALYAAFRQVSSRPLGLAAEFKWLCNKRGIEVRRMTADQIDFIAKRWELPWVRNKAEGIAQPLTDRMVEIIKEALGNRSTGYVFSTTIGDSQVALGSKLNREIIDIAGTPWISWHDFRRTFNYFATLDHERLDVLDCTMGHKVYKNVAASYGDERALHGFMLARYEKWQRFCEGE
ncbi:integrase family protein [Rhodospirillales bacterium]|nr:integrase family protein [Rhodospirillales bacterium]